MLHCVTSTYRCGVYPYDVFRSPQGEEGVVDCKITFIYRTCMELDMADRLIGMQPLQIRRYYILKSLVGQHQAFHSGMRC